MKKKIIYIVESFSMGVFTIINDITNKLSDRYDFVILYGKRDETPENFKSYFDKKIKFIEIKNFRRKIGFHDFLAIKEIKKIIKDEKPDIVHLHSSKAGALGRMCIKNIKMFYTPHSYSFLNNNKIRKYNYKLIERILSKINKKCKIVACSQSEYNKTIKFNQNVITINNSIDINKIDKIVNNITEKKSICTCGRICKQKNPKMFNSIALAFPEIEFFWIGDGKMKNVLTSKNIHILGNLPHEQALKKVMENSIFILPSLWEGLSISLLEAMYLEKVCLVSNIDSNKNVIKNHVDGFVCKNKQDYIDVINKIINNEIDVEKIKNNAKSKVIKEYNFEKMCEEYINIYEQ